MAGLIEEREMMSFILIAAFLSIPMSLSFLALIEMSQTQEAKVVARDDDAMRRQLAKSARRADH